MTGSVVRNEALRALAGADRLLELFLSATRMGPDNLHDTSYAIKARVKSEDSLVRKTYDKRQQGKTYNPLDATDIIGVRFICINSSELLGLCRRFISLVEFCQHDSVGIISGRNINEAIKEIIVYQTRSSGDDYDEVFNYLRKLPLKNKSKRIKKETLEEKTDRRYSSIHIVCVGKLYYEGLSHQVPIEVQIRTAFEDTWGEIQHKVQYKADRSAINNEHIRVRYDNVIRNLNNLKRHLDNATQQADIIKREIDDIRLIQTTNAVFPSAIGLSRWRWPRGDQLSLPDDLKEGFYALDDALAQKHEALGKYIDDHKHADDAVKSLNEAIVGLKEFDESYRSLDKRRFQYDYGTQFLLASEMALALFWMGRIEEDMGQTDSASIKVNQAIAILRQWKARDGYSGDCLLNFRLANCLLAAKEQAEAIELFELANNNLASDKRFQGGDVYRAIIPRQLGYAYWVAQRASRDKRSKLSSLRTAFLVTAGAFGLFGANDAKAREDVRETLSICANNVISYLSEVFLFHGDSALRKVRKEADVDLEKWVSVTRPRDQKNPRIRQSVIMHDVMEGRLTRRGATSALNALKKDLQLGERLARWSEEVGYIENVVRVLGGSAGARRPARRHGSQS